MSRHDEGGSPLLALLALCALALLTRSAGAQTIADYSRVQRALLESAMTQAAARSAGLGASAPGPAASAIVITPPATSRVSTTPFAPAVQISGVFASGAGAVAEVIVNATAYLLGAGEGVPGTRWRVESIAIDRVVLSRHDAGSAAGDADGARRVFPLPTLR